MKLRKMKKRTLNRELTILMMIVSACTVLSACVAVLYVFFSFFIQNTYEDIEYVLKKTSQDFQACMQFIEDGAVSIRHDHMLDDFFSCKEAVENGERAFGAKSLNAQLSYSMDLYSDRNMIEKRIPFVTSVYLFNNEDQCIYEHYYAQTLEDEIREKNKYDRFQKKFQNEDIPYECITDEKSIYLLFRIYDDVMEEKGICVLTIHREAVRQLLNATAIYTDCVWMVVFGDSRVIAFRGEWTEIEELVTKKKVLSEMISLSDKDMICCADVNSFHIRTVIAVGKENIFSGLRSTMIMFGIGLGIVVLLTICVAFLASKRFTKQVSRMIESIRAFGGQNFSVRMGEFSIREFHDIGLVFNEMADKIEHLISQVYEKQLLAANAQTKYLQSQINPHFQFNILAMLSLKAKMVGNEEVYEGLRAFSKLTQGKIFREKEIKIKVSEELEIVRFYLYLQKSRYPEKLSYEIEVENEQINQNLIPRLLIEPLVENAVSHGLEPKRESGKVTVRLFEKKDSGQCKFHICVEDDGIGFDTEQMTGLSEENDFIAKEIEHTHTGLENTKRMLRILYGDRQEFHIKSIKGQGTKIEIILPVERGEQYVEDYSGR